MSDDINWEQVIITAVLCLAVEIIIFIVLGVVRL